MAHITQIGQMTADIHSRSGFSNYGSMSRLLTLLLLYRSGYIVGKVGKGRATGYVRK